MVFTHQLVYMWLLPYVLWDNPWDSPLDGSLDGPFDVSLGVPRVSLWVNPREIS